jgi:hypothetical protein
MRLMASKTERRNCRCGKNIMPWGDQWAHRDQNQWTEPTGADTICEDGQPARPWSLSDVPY